MSSHFRLGRLLRVRAEEERTAKAAWASSTANARAAAAANADAARALQRARHEAAGSRSGAVPGFALGAAPVEETVFAAMGAEITRTGAAAESAAEAAAGARLHFDEARGRVLALERLEQRWRREQRRTRRRREARALDETLAATAAREHRLGGGTERR